MKNIIATFMIIFYLTLANGMKIEITPKTQILLNKKGRLAAPLHMERC